MEVTITEAQTRLAELINRAMQGESVIIQAAGGARVALVNKTTQPAETPVQRAVRVGREMGQSEDILRRIEAGELHPIMAMYGLGGEEWDQIGQEIYANRERQGSRPAPEF